MKICSYFLTAFAFVATTLADPPKGWFMAGDKPKEYSAALDHKTVHSGKGSANLRSISEGIYGFGTLMQQSAPGEFSGHRVRMSAWIKTKDVSDWAGLWFRIDGPESKPLGFDNMQNRPLRGTVDWKKYEIVLDVPARSIGIAYGVLISGTGQAWLDDVTLEIVSQDVPLTIPPSEDQSIKTPTNLGFEE